MPLLIIVSQYIYNPDTMTGTLHLTMPSCLTSQVSHQLLNFETADWKLPMDIRLADNQFYRPNCTDLLIGADVFYEILLAGRRIHSSNYPVLQETVLG
jgi:hypothetical protein